MSERSLVVKHGDLEAIEAALVAAQEKIGTQIDELLTLVDRTLEEWAAETASRTAQITYKAKLRNTVEELTNALGTVKSALTQVRDDAHQTEVDNVAIVD